VNDERMAAVARALAHSARVRIIRLLAGQAECRGAELFSELPLAQSTVSQHLRVLREAGLVTSHQVGTSTVYCLVTEVMREFRMAIGEFAEADVCSLSDTPGAA